MIVAVIMAGGKGERFWPKSRETNPKQCLKIISNRSMVEETIERLKPLFSKKDIYISTNEKLAKHIRKTLPNVNYVIEPIAKDTAAAIGLSASYITKKQGDAIMFIETTDHTYKSKNEYLKHVKFAIDLANENYIVLIGIKPTEPHTGFGYIQKGKPVKVNKIKAYKIRRFKEKPDIKTAKVFFKSGEYLWNSGMFVSKCSVMLEAIKKHMPELYLALRKIKKNNFNKKIAKKEFKNLKKVSIDYGVMEKAKNTIVIEANMKWDDIGDWRAMERIHQKDKDWNVVIGKHFGLNTKNCIIWGDNLVATYDIKDLIIVSTKDSVMVIPKNRAQKVKELVEEMKKNKRFKKYL